MIDELLPHYQRELVEIRRRAGEFAAAHPKIAGRLRLTADAADDPFVARLIEAVAYLNARIQLRLDDAFPELTDALLGVLHPHWLAPVPSMAIARFTPQADLSGPHTVPAGAELVTGPVAPAEGRAPEPCRFRTAWPATLWPVEIETVALKARPVAAPAIAGVEQAVAVLKIGLRMTQPGRSFTEIGLDRLRLFIAAPGAQATRLYERLTNDVAGIAVATGPEDPRPVRLGPDAVAPVGFAGDEGLLPDDARTLPAYRLLTEYFAFPEKFLFLDLNGLDARTLAPVGDRLEIHVFLTRHDQDLERAVTAESFALGAVPIVNLFRQAAEPIRLDQRQSAYRVVPDARRPLSTEIFRILRVEGSDAGGRRQLYQPFHSVAHGTAMADETRRWWHAERRPAGPRDPASEIYLSLVDDGFNPSEPATGVLSVDTLCLNRDLPARLPFGGGHPVLKPAEAMSAIRSVTCLTPPTRTLRPEAGAHGRWRLISFLSLNHLSLTDDTDGAAALRELLALHDLRDAPETRAAIDAITGISHRRGMARVPGDRFGGMARGLDVTLELDPERYATGGLYLLAAVLDRVFGLYCTINSFTRLTAKLRGRPGTIRTWPPRAGAQDLV